MRADRRSFLLGLTTLVASPAIVRASSLMHVSPVPVELKWHAVRPTRRFVVQLSETGMEWIDISARPSPNVVVAWTREQMLNAGWTDSALDHCTYLVQERE